MERSPVTGVRDPEGGPEADGVWGLVRALGRTTVAAPDVLTVEGRDLPVTVRRNPAARRLILRLSPCGTLLRLTAPPHVPARTIRDFLERNRPWVAERLARARSPVSVSPGATIPFRGSPLALEQGAGRSTILVPPENGENARLLVGGDPAHFARRVKDFVRREARTDLEEAVARHSTCVGIRPSGLDLKDTTSRWGSCSTTRRLSFSFRIVLAPPFALDYLAAHEVAHLREMNHGPAFWSLCRQLCPGMESGRAWLKANGASLHAIDFG